MPFENEKLIVLSRPQGTFQSPKVVTILSVGIVAVAKNGSKATFLSMKFSSQKFY